MLSDKFCNAQSLTTLLSKSFAFVKNHDQFLPNLILKFSILINNYAQDVTFKATMTSLFTSRRRSFCETSQLHRMLTKTVVSTARRSLSAAPLDVEDVKVSAADNVGQRSPPKDGETQPVEYSVTSSNRRFSSPSGKERDIRGTSADRRSRPPE